MKIANADKLKKHFENVVDVHLFTVPTILTIIDTFSSEVDENDLISRKDVLTKVADEFDGIQCYDGSGADIVSDVEETVNKVKPFFGGDKP